MDNRTERFASLAVNILFITRHDPRQASSGTEQRTRLLWQALGRLGTVYVAVLSDSAGVVDDDEAARIHGVVLETPVRLVDSILSFFAGALRQVAWPFRSSRLIRRRIGWESVRFDVVVTRYLQTAGATRAWRIAPCFVDIDDWPEESYLATSGRNHHRFRRFVSVFLVRGFTRHVLRRCKGAWIPNRFQVGSVEKDCPCGYLPNLAMAPRPGYRPNGGQRLQLMTVGVMGYGPNRDGVDWFLKEIWPEARRRFPALEYAVAGGSLPEEYRARWSRTEGVRVLGFVEDIDRLYQESLAVVTPILDGAGTCIKVMEAVARGRKLFATPVSARGMTARELEEMSVVSFMSAEEFCTALEEWMRTPDADRAVCQKAIAEAGHPFCEEESFQKIVRKTLVGYKRAFD